MSKPFIKHDEVDETEGETTDYSEDPLSCSESSSFSNWNGDMAIPAIESSFRQISVDMEPPSKMPSRSCLKTKGRKRRQSIKYTGEVEVYLPMCTTPLRRRTCVSFKPSVAVRTVVPVPEMTENIKSLWFQQDDYTRIAHRCKLIARMEMRGERYNGRALCSRGLEGLISPNRRDTDKFDGWASVFHEQEIQWTKRHYDEEKIRMMYESASSQSMIEAQKRGMNDEDAAQRYLQSARSMCDNISLL